MNSYTYELTMENRGVSASGVNYKSINAAPVLTTHVRADNQQQAIERAEWRNPTHKVKSCVKLD